MTFEESLKNFFSKLHELSWERKATLIIIMVSIIVLLFGNNWAQQGLGSQQEKYVETPIIYLNNSDPNISDSNRIFYVDPKGVAHEVSSPDQIPYDEIENSWTTSTPKPTIELSLGQSATSHNNMQVTVYSAQRVSSYSYEETTSDGTHTRLVNASNGKDFIILDIELKNIGSSDTYGNIIDSFTYIRDSDANSYHIQAGYRGDDRFSHDNQYISGEHSRGKIAYQVPSTAKDLQFCTGDGGYPIQMICWRSSDQYSFYNWI